MRLRSFAVLTLLAAALGCVAASPPAFAANQAPALSLASPLAGFAWIDGPGPADPATSFDSAGGAVSATENVSGIFAVTFAGLGALSSGNVQVSGLDPQGSCVVQDWGSDGTNLTVAVDCYHLGVASDEQFDVLVTQAKHSYQLSGVLDYLWDNHPNSSAAPAPPYTYNSSRKSNVVRHLRTGQYEVIMPGPPVTGANTGTVKVTAYGQGSGNCQLVSWAGTKTGQQIFVDCFTAAGALANRQFVIIYARDTNLLGINAEIDANAFANSAVTVSQPPVQYDSVHGARVTVVHYDTGEYEVIDAGSSPTRHPQGGNGHAELTVTGAKFVTCGFNEQNTHQPVAFVTCYNAANHPTNTAFTMQWVVTK